MDVRQTTQAKDLLVLLRPPQAKALSRGDFDTLEVQLYLLEKEVTEEKRRESIPLLTYGHQKVGAGCGGNP